MNLSKMRRDIEAIMLGKIKSNKVEQIISGYFVELIDTIEEMSKKIEIMERSFKEKN